MRRMKRNARLALYAAVCLTMVFAWGCEEGQSSDPDIGNVKKHRLIAAENRALQGEIEDLKGEITKRDTDIVALKDDHAKQIEAEKAIQAKITSERDRLRARNSESVKQEVNAVMMGVMAINERLKAENNALKLEIARLKGPKPVPPKPTEENSDNPEPATDEGQ